MADVSANLKDWSGTAASNSPSGSTVIGTGLDDNLRQIQATVRQDLATVGADITAAATTDLGAIPGLFHTITGNTGITSFGTVAAGIWKILTFSGTPTITHNGTSLICPNAANITIVAGDSHLVESLGSGNWKVHGHTHSPVLVAPVLGTPVSGDLTNCTGAQSAGIPQNSQSVAYVAVLGDANKHLLHPTADNNPRTFTIPSNSSVAYLLGTTITFVNQINTLTIDITPADTLTLAGVGTTGSRTLNASGMATAIKVGTTSWVITGQGIS